MSILPPGIRRAFSFPPAVVLAATFLLTAVAGCITTGRGDLPLGEWSGRGTFIYEEWAPGGPAGQGEVPATAPSPVTISRDYETTLSLRPDKLDDLDIIRIEIRSLRGELPNLDDQTHLVGALVPGKRIGADARLYRAVALQYNPEPGEKLSVQDDAPPFIATCTTRGGTTTFRICYTENFVDVFRFEGAALEKDGLYFNDKRGLVHWTERLTRR